jgi:hypothetical protein
VACEDLREIEAEGPAWPVSSPVEGLVRTSIARFWSP